MKVKGFWIVFLVLLVVGCTMVSARDKESARQVAATPTAVSRPTSQPPTPAQESGYGEAQYVVERAVVDLQARLGVGAENVAVQDVVPTEFSDTSLGMPEPGVMYAQVLTPGYVIRLAVGDQVYIYHGSGERVVLAAQETHKVISVPGDQPVPPASGEAEYSRVEIADTGLSIDVPSGWLRLEPAWLWTPAEGSELFLGVNWIDLQPPQEAEPALLPTPSQTLYSEEVTLGWGQGRRFLLEVYTPAAQGGEQKAAVASVEIHVVAMVKRGEMYRAFDLYVRGTGMEDMGALDPMLQRVLDSSTMAGVGPQTPVEQGLALVGSDPTTGWSVLRDDTYGYQIGLPADWTWKELPAQVPGMPDDWPVTRIVLLYPQAWDAEINRSGPPDPTAKPVIAPLQIEVVVGPAEQFRRVYPEPMQSEMVEINGLPVTVEREIYETMVLTRYAVVSPDDPEVRVAITDQMTGFVDRVAGNEAIAELVPATMATFKFAQ
jgi:hypothetical protein